MQGADRRRQGCPQLAELRHGGAAAPRRTDGVDEGQGALQRRDGRSAVAGHQGLPPAYHAAAALAANGGAALATSAVDILVRLGVADAPARAAIAALLRTVADNVERVGVPRALTGPVARGDAETVSAHRTALAQLGGSGLASYDAIAGSILACAREAGLSPEAAHAVEQAVLASVPRDY